jgi:O-methyltransferase/methyltransferase family protein
MSNSNPDPQNALALFRMANGYVAAQALYVASDLGVADYLTQGALTAQELASKTGSHPDALARLLRALVAFGILNSADDERFTLTPLGEFLRSDVPGSMRSAVRFVAGPSTWRAWENLPHSIRTAEPAFDHAWGMPIFEYSKRHPEASKILDEAMEGLSTQGSAAILAAYDFSQFRTLVDVGGGNGALLATVLRQHAALRGRLADLPHVVSRAAEVLNRAGVADRCEIIGCDFFETVPAGGDGYVLKSIIHDWDNTHALKILRNCHRAMKPSATLLLLERVLPEQPAVEAALRYLMDLAMLVMTPGGRERTPAEFHKLLEAADFEFLGVTPTGGPYDIITARKS